MLSTSHTPARACRAVLMLVTVLTVAAHRLRCRIVLALITLAAPALHAADPATGFVRGVVSNAATKLYLDGAEVVLNPGGRVVLTARDGRFECQGMEGRLGDHFSIRGGNCHHVPPPANPRASDCR